MIEQSSSEAVTVVGRMSLLPDLPLRAGVLCLALLVFACGGVTVRAAPSEQRAPGPPALAASVGGSTQEATRRAAFLRRRVEQYKGWGGHSPVPQRVINSTTFAKMLKEVSPADEESLVLLVHDSAADIRDMAGMLISCLIPDARSMLEARQARETDLRRRWQLQEAINQVGYTMCPPAPDKPVRTGATSSR